MFVLGPGIVQIEADSMACGGHTIAEAWAMVWCKVALVVWGALR